MINEERDSQLSAMFDDELPQGECELLARRLARDPVLQARWGHYAAIGACLRGQTGVRLEGQNAGQNSGQSDGRNDGNFSVAERVRLALGQEPIALADEVSPARRPAPRWLTPLAGFATAAGVAAVSILWLRSQSQVSVVAQTQSPRPAAVSAPAPVLPAQALLAQASQAPNAAPNAQGSAPRARDSYVVPPHAAQVGPSLVLPAQDANYQGPAQYPGPVH